MHVVLTTDEPLYLAWADQFVAHSESDRARVIYPRSDQTDDDTNDVLAAIRQKYEEAASAAGQHGRVIVSVGHGGAGGPDSAAMVDLAPAEAFRLTAPLLTDVSRREGDETIIRNTREMAGTTPAATYCQQLLDPPRGESRSPLPEGLDRPTAELRCGAFPHAMGRTALRDDYAQIGAVFRHHNVAEVMFLTCNVGNAPDFMERIATDWQVTILAYGERILADDGGDDEDPHLPRGYRAEIEF